MKFIQRRASVMECSLSYAGVLIMHFTHTLMIKKIVILFITENSSLIFSILTWEDGYYDHPKPTKIVGIASDNIYFNGAKSLPFSSCETSMDDYASVGCPIGLSLTNMSSLQFALGERYSLVFDYHYDFHSFIL